MRLHCCASRIWYNLSIPSRRGGQIVSGPGVECQLKHIVWTPASNLDHYKGTVVPEIVNMLEFTAKLYSMLHSHTAFICTYQCATPVPGRKDALPVFISCQPQADWISLHELLLDREMLYLVVVVGCDGPHILRCVSPCIRESGSVPDMT